MPVFRRYRLLSREGTDAAFLEAGDLKLVVRVAGAERGDGGVQIAVLAPQARQPLAHFLFGHGRYALIARLGRFAAPGV